LRQNLLHGTIDNIEYAPLKTILAEVMTTLQNNIQVAHARLQVELNGLAEVNFPQVHFKSVFYNLLTNAIKYRDGQKPLEIKVEAYQKDTGTYVFVIEDNGLGMDLSLSQGKLYGIFKRFHNHVEGEGIGLHIVKSVVDAYDGTIEVKSEPGKGTRFEIVFNKKIFKQS
jgi:signal transduction histidine kinase